MKHYLFVFLFFSVTITGYSQTIRKNINDMGLFPINNAGGEVTLMYDSKFETILLNRREANKNKLINGWRVQIFFGSGSSAKAEAEKAKKDFLKRFPDIPAYLLYEAPYFKVRVGDFRTKMEAAKMKKDLTGIFTNTFIMEEKISLPPL